MSERNLSRKQLLHIAIRAADKVLAGSGRGRLRRRSPSPALIKKAEMAAYAEILRRDELAATTHHRSVKFVHQAVAIARRGVTLARRLTWTGTGGGNYPAWTSRVGRDHHKTTRRRRR